MDRTRNTLRNGIWGIGQKVLMLLAPFVIRTLIIKNLGAEYLGLNGLFVSLLQVLNLVELGFSSAITFSLYKPIAEDNKIVICGLLNVYKKIYKGVGIGILTIGLILSPFLRFIIKGDIPSDINLHLLYFLYLFNTVISYLLFAYKAVLLEASQRNDIIYRTQISTQLTQYIVQIAMLIIFHDYYAYYIFTPIFTCLYNIWLSNTVDKKYPLYKASGSISDKLKNDLIIRIKGVIIGKICAVSRNAIFGILISASAGLYSVATYSNYFLIITSLSSFLTVITSAMSASVGNSMATESEEKNHNDFKKFTFIYAWISGVCLCCLTTTLQTFMQLWLGEKMLLPFYMVIGFGAYFYILTTGDIRSTYMNSKGLWWENRYRTILEATSNIIFSIIFMKIFGLVGAILGPLLSMCIFNFGMSSTILYKYCFPSYRCLNYWTDYIFYMIVTFAACLSSEVITSKLMKPIDNLYIYLILCIVISIIISNLLFIIFFHKLSYYKESKIFLLKMIK